MPPFDQAKNKESIIISVKKYHPAPGGAKAPSKCSYNNLIVKPFND